MMRGAGQQRNAQLAQQAEQFAHMEQEGETLVQVGLALERQGLRLRGAVAAQRVSHCGSHTVPSSLAGLESWAYGLYTAPQREGDRRRETAAATRA